MKSYRDKNAPLSIEAFPAQLPLVYITRGCSRSSFVCLCVSACLGVSVSRYLSIGDEFQDLSFSNLHLRVAGTNTMCTRRCSNVSPAMGHKVTQSAAVWVSVFSFGLGFQFWS